ncbi:MAG: Gfo/Idh/MocA family oxidoreductase [Candidatus Heimdallarchaeota archaeon]|nr:Gfo/Idh/MocA family oxidoreductase [Candidatus Heimdallarchaeota archaeon]MCK4955687.1 Gfo/Idh/MocA family oxidoreductase [Candidatus Heimdallarchaeota archaeon]
MPKKLTAILIGAGDRGANTYGDYALRHPEEIKFLAVAEPLDLRRELFAEKHRIQKKYVFTSWESLLKSDKLADIAVIATQDQMHAEPAIQAMEKGYDVLLEKPMATTIEECKKLVEVSERTGKLLQICHVLRYTEFFSLIHSIIQSGKIGDVVNISLRENVSSFHYAHSYIRGNWHNREEASPMILAKSCHDMDMLFWLIGSPSKSISSFGSQSHFGSLNQPEGAPDRCTDGCSVSESCLYFAPRIYIDIEPLLQVGSKGGKFFDKLISKAVLNNPKLKKIYPFSSINKFKEWPVSVISKDLSIEGRIKALKETNYGKCVYAIDDHNVVDHQVVNIEFDNEVTATFTMHGFSYEEGRTIRIDGTRGTIIGDFLFSGDTIRLMDAYTGKEEIIRKTGIISGHSGGDDRLMNAFLQTVKMRSQQEILTDARSALESHLMAFAADKARLENTVVDMEKIRN